jgi:hypothetical protein
VRCGIKIWGHAVKVILPEKFTALNAILKEKKKIQNK